MMHQKHAKLTRPKGGQWGRTEVAIMGAPCFEIKELSAALIKSLSPESEIAYVDADHNAVKTDAWAALDYGAKEQLTNKISHFEIQLANEQPYYFNNADLVLINGNHFKANSQIAWVHPKKSLEKKLEKLTNVGLVILEDEISEMPDFLKEHLSSQEVNVIKRSDISSITKYFIDLLEENRPPIHGLVLIGGKSARMKKDKSQLVYHDGLPQHEYSAKLLENVCDNVYISVRDDEQAADFNRPTITDKFIGLGPYGGILSAFQQNPNVAWMVVAVDLPYLDEATLKQLKDSRNIHKTATCFIDPKNEFPEPLITIWEPSAYPVLLNFLAKGYSCPRKALINSDVEIIIDRSVKALTNANTPEEYQKIIDITNG